MNSIIEFLFPRRLHRLSYFIRMMVTNGSLFFLSAYGETASPVVLWLLFIGILLYQPFFIVLSRMRDLNMRWGWLFLILVPGANIVFGIILLWRAPCLPPKAQSDEPPVPESAPGPAPFPD